MLSIFDIIADMSLDRRQINDQLSSTVVAPSIFETPSLIILKRGLLFFETSTASSPAFGDPPIGPQIARSKHFQTLVFSR